MREIKFRTWDGEEMDYEPFAEWGALCLESGKLMKICGPEGETWTESSKEILMQYIGLKDKNGKEIYEGDIIHIWSEYTDGRIYDEGNWEIYWRNDRWHLRRGEEGFDNGDYYQGDECPWPDADDWKPAQEGPRIERIGNIYENPELLKEK